MFKRIIDFHLNQWKTARFSSLNYSILDKLDSRPLYAAASLAHPSQKEALFYLVREA